MRSAKIVGTLGPASSSVESIAALIKAGLNVTRVNMSHGTHEGHAQVIKNIRKASEIVGREVAILLDLQGPKIRADKLPQNLQLKDGSTWVIGPTSVQSEYPQYKDCFIPTIYNKLVDDANVGDRILFDDGLIVAKAIGKDGKVLKIQVEVGGELKSNKGINLPDSNVSAPSFTEKDRADLLFGLEQGIDYIALSFVRTKEDILNVKYLLHEMKKDVPIVSKIEKPQAITNIDEIIAVTDAIMVARGDMGVELGNHLVPSTQKLIISKCNEAGVPVITATQMLESMIHNSTPTRAEASDVANAVWDGTDAVMLSAETASGSYPVRAVEMMVKIIKEAEKTPKNRPLLRNIDMSSTLGALMVSASMIAEKINAKKIIAVTESGSSCRTISRFRPRTQVLGVTNSMEIVRRMCLYWGVRPFFYQFGKEPQLERDIIGQIREEHDLRAGDKVVITGGDGKFFVKGSATQLKIEVLQKTPEETEEAKKNKQSYNAQRGNIAIDTSKCVPCGNICVDVCPHDVWKAIDERPPRIVINQSTANSCSLDMKCVEVCPAKAITLTPK